jgi:tetratricopeptide (TPR) repeat protein
VHNIAYALTELGRFREAGALLLQNRERYERHAGPVDLLKRAWVEGTIHAGLGDLEAAERCLLEARAGFKAAGARYNHALVSLDLAAVWLRRGRTLLARQLVEDAAAVFRQLGIAREALAAVLVLQRAFELDVASVALLDPVATYLRRLARDPSVRCEPGEG